MPERDADSDPDVGPDDFDVVPSQVRLAGYVLWVEVLALLAAAVIVIDKAITGHPAKWWSPWVLVAFILLGAWVLYACGRGLLRLSAAARTPVVMLQLLALPVSFDLAFQAHRIGYGGPILVAALVVLYLLFTPAARAALDRVPD